MRWSDLEVRDRARTVRLCRDAPLVHEELSAGRLSVAQVREIARARSNPRVGPGIVDVIGILVDHAEHLPFLEFRICVQRWEALADVDGAHHGHEAAHAGRSAHASIVGDEFRLDANGGVIDGTAISEILSRFEQAEFDADWAELLERFGDDATPSMLSGPPAQRRFDALRAIFEKAASTMPGARAPEPVVNILVDEAWIAGGADGPLPDSDRRRCETTDDVQVAPADAMAAALRGHVRRVVMDSAGVVINLGRKVRLFTGSAREAAKLQGSRCS